MSFTSRTGEANSVARVATALGIGDEAPLQTLALAVGGAFIGFASAAVWLGRGRYHLLRAATAAVTWALLLAAGGVSLALAFYLGVGSLSPLEGTEVLAANLLLALFAAVLGSSCYWLANHVLALLERPVPTRFEGESQTSRTQSAQ